MFREGGRPSPDDLENGATELVRHQNYFGADSAQLEGGAQVRGQKYRESTTLGTGAKMDTSPNRIDEDANADEARANMLRDQVRELDPTRATVEALTQALLSLGIRKENFQINAMEVSPGGIPEKTGMDRSQIGNAMTASRHVVECTVPGSQLEAIRERLVSGVDLGFGRGSENFGDVKGSPVSVDAASEAGLGETLMKRGEHGETIMIRLLAGEEKEAA